MCSKLNAVNGESCDKTNCPATVTTAFILHIVQQELWALAPPSVVNVEDITIDNVTLT